MAVKKETLRSGWQEAGSIMLIALAALCFLGMVSYEWRDISSLQTPPNDPPANFIGPVGAWISYVLFSALGVAGYLIPVGLLYLGLATLLKPDVGMGRRIAWLVVLMLSATMLLELNPEGWRSASEHLNLGFTGGMIGTILTQRILVGLIGAIGAAILAVALLFISLIMLMEVHPVVLWGRITSLFKTLAEKVDEWRRSRMDRRQQLEEEEKEIARRRRQIEDSMKAKVKTVRKAREEPAEEIVAIEPEPEPPPPEPPPPKPKPFFERKPKEKPAPPPEPPPPPPVSATGYQLPSIALLDPPHTAVLTDAPGDLHISAELLKETLAEFDVEVEVTNVERGPVVTRYELLPAAGVRVEKITGLSNNIALAMKAESIRVQAPIPGKGVVGIEIPNSTTTTVFFREIIESNYWRSGKAALPLALGKDVGGHVLVADLADMPHMLIAGATGAGKTVCMNSILTGLLMARTPDEMKLMLVDPKIVEFSNYNTLPHLVVPVITDPKKVSHGLRWAISEMERRYKLFAKVNVRHIKGYNNRPLVKQEELFAGDAVTGAPPPPADDKTPDRLPYIVIVIDELADLMMVAQAEVENYIARLAQLSRATGIHMIIATQRPSVNVITGTIKANFPARISFQVAQKVDSRTILDAAGADKLLGKGDMLFLSPGSGKLIRAQGTFTSDGEIHRVVDFIKQQGHQPVFETAIKEKIESAAADLPEMEENDDLLEAAIEIIRQTKRASTSSLQRRLRIGYTRAARIMDILEEKGIVGPAQGSDPREILIDLDGEVPAHSEEGNNT
ncbi:MAG TPA: DNA translocase FtsK 4TM domain-containing protein [Kiritimatiellia bacterium]|nr:DNA translocase FtsK 4TM domain-containing protein [Kiritimatiellia bacterium]